MAFTYSGDPSDSDLDAIRFVLGDTDSNDYELEDAEITHCLTIQPTPRLAAAACASTIAARFARKVSMSAGSTSVNYSDLFNHWMQIYRGLIHGTIGIFAGEDGSGHSPTMTIGGASLEERETIHDDDAISPPFDSDDNT